MAVAVVQAVTSWTGAKVALTCVGASCTARTSLSSAAPASTSFSQVKSAGSAAAAGEAQRGRSAYS